jgi:endoglucanase
MAYAPGLWSSHVYAGVAARAAHVMRLLGSERADEYEENALSAMEWAEREFADWPSRPEYGQVRDGAKERVRDDRCLAGVELYRLTGEERWHAVFAETTRLRGDPQDLSDRQRDAAFAYATLPEKETDPELRRAAIDFTVRDAERAVAFARGNAWGITTPYYERAPYMGFYTMPGSMQVVRGHVLTGRADFLEAIVRSCVFGAGGNPMNLCMTTGVGHDWPRNPLHVDSRHSGQPAPAGITLYGAADIPSLRDSHYWTWPLKQSLADDCTPSGWDWPPPEGYFDIYSWAAVCEYTIMQTLGPNSYVWGYLAARP